MAEQQPEVHLMQRIDMHLRQLAPHAKERDTGALLIEARAELSRLQAAGGQGVEPVKPAIAEAIHYPDCWDQMAYPTLESALHELTAWFQCSECAHPAAPALTYRLLEDGEIIQPDDEYLNDDCVTWDAFPPADIISIVGEPHSTERKPVRRKEVPSDA